MGALRAHAIENQLSRDEPVELALDSAPASFVGRNEDVAGVWRSVSVSALLRAAYP